MKKRGERGKGTAIELGRAYCAFDHRLDIDRAQTEPSSSSVQPYQNLNGNSGVASYESGPDSITVQFRDGDTYVYDDTQPGADHVQRMKELAEAGRGLSTYISKYVRDRYARKVR